MDSELFQGFFRLHSTTLELYVGLGRKTAAGLSVCSQMGQPRLGISTLNVFGYCISLCLPFSVWKDFLLCPVSNKLLKQLLQVVIVAFVVLFF